MHLVLPSKQVLVGCCAAAIVKGNEHVEEKWWFMVTPILAVNNMLTKFE